jgi:hypothetical protein
MDLIDVDDAERSALVAELASAAVGLGELDPAVDDLDRLSELLVGSFASWDGRVEGGSSGS